MLGTDIREILKEFEDFSSQKTLVEELVEGRGHIAFLGAIAGSPYIVFISTSGMLRSSDIYI